MKILNVSLKLLLYSDLKARLFYRFNFIQANKGKKEQKYRLKRTISL